MQFFQSPYNKRANTLDTTAIYKNANLYRKRASLNKKNTRFSSWNSVKNTIFGIWSKNN